jgi:hypothetical protein
VIRQLAERFLHDRDSLDEADLEALASGLEEDPELAGELRRMLVIDELLGQCLTTGHERLIERVAGRLTAARRPRSTPMVWASLAAAAIVLALVVWRIPRSRVDAPPLRIVSTGDPQVMHADRMATAVDRAIEAGDALVVPPLGALTLRYDDGTTVTLGGGTNVFFSGDQRQQKRLRIVRGSITIEAVPQSTSAPLVVSSAVAEATVLGTRFTLRVQGDDARLDVDTGLVRFAKLDGSEGIEVAGGRFAVATAGQPLASFPRTLLVKFGAMTGEPPSDTVVDTGAHFTAERGYGWSHPNLGEPLPGVVWNGWQRTKDRIPTIPRVPAVDPLFDTALSVGWANHTEHWRMRLPNGGYLATVCVGDALDDQGPHRVVLQGAVVIDGVLTAAGSSHQMRQIPVSVTDGELTMEVGGCSSFPPSSDGSSDTTIQFLRITSVP